MSSNQTGSEKPNIVFILSDDQGAWAMRCAGTREIYTPNLDRISAQSEIGMVHTVPEGMAPEMQNGAFPEMPEEDLGR